MIIITENSSELLLKALETARDELSSERCLWFNLQSCPLPISKWLDQIENALFSILDDKQAHFYLCEDGDAFLIAHGLNYKKTAEIYRMIYPFIGTPENPNAVITIHELNNNSHTIIAAAQDKFDVILKTRLEAQRQKEEENKKIEEQRNRAILGLKISDETKNSMAKKKKREDFEILLVDDDIFSSHMVTHLLSKRYTIHKAVNGWEAVMSYVGNAPDVVFLDIDMPSVNGHEILAKILEIDPEAYIIMLSGHSHQDNIVKAIKNGAKGFITKPFTKEKIFHYLNLCPTLATRKQKVSVNV